MFGDTRLRELLKPFGLELNPNQLSKILIYLELLVRWNQKINLTAIRAPEEAVTRHFGESLLLGRSITLQGSLLDIGSGAGFPGLALKIAFPELAVTLLEPIAKKRAFLKEVARVCDLHRVDVRPERLREFISRPPASPFETVTARAVGALEELVPQAVRCLAPGGRLCLWVSRDQSSKLLGAGMLEWQEPIAVPLGQQREIWIGVRKQNQPNTLLVTDQIKGST